VSPDYDASPPWEDDGHGPVTDWTRRCKRAGEIILSTRGENCRYYDFAGAVKKAREEGWGLTQESLTLLTTRLGREPTRGQVCAEAAEQDFAHLKGWCEDCWEFVSIHVEVFDGEKKTSDLYVGRVGSDEWRLEAAAMIRGLTPGGGK
jgi:hypothetical protein